MHPMLQDLMARWRASGRGRLAGLGDSLTYGWEVSRGFFDRFADGLAERLAGVRLERENAGVPGDTAAGGLSRLGPVLEGKPDLVVVQFGINDLFVGVRPTEYAAALGSIADEVRAASALPLLVSSCPLAMPGEDERLLGMYRAGAEVAAARGLPFGRLDEYWRRERADRPAGSWLGCDGVHPDDDGHAVLAAGLLALFDGATDPRAAPSV